MGPTYTKNYLSIFWNSDLTEYPNLSVFFYLFVLFFISLLTLATLPSPCLDPRHPVAYTLLILMAPKSHITQLTGVIWEVLSSSLLLTPTPIREAHLHHSKVLCELQETSTVYIYQLPILFMWIYMCEYTSINVNLPKSWPTSDSYLYLLKGKE